MIGMSQPNLPPLPNQRDLDSLMALAALLADPKAAQARIAEIQRVSDAAAQIVAQAERDRSAVIALRNTTTAELDAARKANAAEIEKEREAHNEACRRRSDDLDAREKRVKEIETTAATNAEQAACIKADLERRFKLVTAA